MKIEQKNTKHKSYVTLVTTDAGKQFTLQTLDSGIVAVREGTFESGKRGGGMFRSTGTIKNCDSLDEALAYCEAA